MVGKRAPLVAQQFNYGMPSLEEEIMWAEKIEEADSPEHQPTAPDSPLPEGEYDPGDL
jgi:hypothetical protein